MGTFSPMLQYQKLRTRIDGSNRVAVALRNGPETIIAPLTKLLLRQRSGPVELIDD